jgi:hypothetical protein
MRRAAPNEHHASSAVLANGRPPCGRGRARTLALSRARCSPFVHHPPPTFGPSPSPTPELQ